MTNYDNLPVRTTPTISKKSYCNVRYRMIAIRDSYIFAL